MLTLEVGPFKQATDSYKRVVSNGINWLEAGKLTGMAGIECNSRRSVKDVCCTIPCVCNSSC